MIINYIGWLKFSSFSSLFTESLTEFLVWAHLRAMYPRPYLCRVTTILRILRYRILCNQPRTVFWILMQAERNLSVRSFSKYATWPARKKIFVFPNWNMSGSWKTDLNEGEAD